ncbi:MAG: bacterial transcriptional activator domain-containing protein [Chloroflexota bacterium]
MSDDIRLRAIGITADSDPVGSIEPAEAEMHEMHRSDLDALKDGAAMLTQAGNRVAALAVMWSAVAIAPTDLGAHRRLAAMLANAGDIDGAANEYARYIEFMIPIGDVGRATMELAYGSKVLGGHAALHQAAEKIVNAVRALVPGDLVLTAPTLPMPRLLPKVPFRFCIHDDGDRHWMQLEGGTAELVPASVRVLDRNDEVVETRKFIPIAPGQKGHAKIIEGEPSGVAWVVLGVSDEVVAALDAGKPSPYRVEVKVGDEWVSTVLVDTGCRIGRRRSRSAVS